MARRGSKKVKPGIHDIAAAAGVSITTVSHALNDKGRLPDATRRHVREVAERIGYVAHPIARGLATGRAMLLGIQASGFSTRRLLPEAAYFLDLINRSAEVAFEHGYGLVLVPPSLPPEQAHGLSLDGAVIVDPLGDEPLLNALRQAGRPVVTTGRVLDGDHAAAWVDNDHVAGARLSLDHLERIGCERPALLTTGVGPSYVADAVQGYRAWCAERGIKPLLARIRGAPSTEAARRVTGKLLDGRMRPDGIYATLDVLATGALEAANERGVAVPGDLALVAVSDSLALRSARPPITALDLRPDELAARAIELLVALAEDKPVGELHLRTPVALKRRQSSRRTSPISILS